MTRIFAATRVFLLERVVLASDSQVNNKRYVADGLIPSSGSSYIGDSRHMALENETLSKLAEAIDNLSACIAIAQWFPTWG